MKKSNNDVITYKSIKVSRPQGMSMKRIKHLIDKFKGNQDLQEIINEVGKALLVSKV